MKHKTLIATIVPFFVLAIFSIWYTTYYRYKFFIKNKSKIDINFTTEIIEINKTGYKQLTESFDKSFSKENYNEWLNQKDKPRSSEKTQNFLEGVNSSTAAFEKQREKYYEYERIKSLKSAFFVRRNLEDIKNIKIKELSKKKSNHKLIIKFKNEGQISLKQKNIFSWDALIKTIEKISEINLTIVTKHDFHHLKKLFTKNEIEKVEEKNFKFYLYLDELSNETLKQIEPGYNELPDYNDYSNLNNYKTIFYLNNEIIYFGYYKIVKNINYSQINSHLTFFPKNNINLKWIKLGNISSTTIKQDGLNQNFLIYLNTQKKLSKNDEATNYDSLYLKINTKWNKFLDNASENIQNNFNFSTIFNIEIFNEFNKADIALYIFNFFLNLKEKIEWWPKIREYIKNDYWWISSSLDRKFENYFIEYPESEKLYKIVMNKNRFINEIKNRRIIPLNFLLSDYPNRFSNDIVYSYYLSKINLKQTEIEDNYNNIFNTFEWTYYEKTNDENIYKLDIYTFSKTNRTQKTIGYFDIKNEKIVELEKTIELEK